MQELKDQQLNIEIYKKKIIMIKRQLENTYNLPKFILIKIKGNLIRYELSINSEVESY